MSEFKIIKAVDRWNATSERTIDDQDHVVVEVTGDDGEKKTVEMSVSEFRNDSSLEGTSDERTEALKGADWRSLSDGGRLQEMSLKGRINTNTSGLAIASSSTRFTEAILSYGRDVAAMVGEVVDLIEVFSAPPTETTEKAKDGDDTKPQPAVIEGAEDTKKPVNLAAA